MDFYGYSISYMITSSWILTLFFIHKNYDTKRFIWISAISIAFTLIPISGTNTGLYKLASITTFPFLLMYLTKYKRSVVSFWGIVFIGVFICGMVSKLRNNTYEDSRILDMDVEPKITQLYGLKTTSERAKYIEDICDKIEHINKNVIVIGNKSLLFEHLYLLGNDCLRPYFWRSYKDDEYVSDVCKYLNENNVSTIISTSDSSIDESPLLSIELSKLSYVLSYEGEEYTMYIKKAEHHE
jgi:hypothetical protein